MTNSISITVPMERQALTRAADMLTAMADDCPPSYTNINETDIDADKPVVQTMIGMVRETAAKKTDESVEIVPTPPAPPVTASSINDPASVFTQPKSIDEQIADNHAIPDDMGTPGAIPGTIELDADGLPWDSRIHSGKKSKLVKTSQWKKKRGVAADLVATVEAELRAAMSAGGGNVTIADNVIALVDDEQAPAAVIPPPPAPPVAADITFPELMAKITQAMAAKTLSEATVIAAVNAQGLASLPLLAVRPDLIPTVNATLFPL